MSLFLPQLTLTKLLQQYHTFLLLLRLLIPTVLLFLRHQHTAAATKTNKTNMKVGFYSSMIHPYLAALLLCVSSMRKRLLLTAIITVSFLCNHFSEGRRIPSYTALLMEKRKEKLRGGGQDTSSTSNSRP